MARDALDEDPPAVDEKVASLDPYATEADADACLARVLFGDVDPGGRLPATFPKSADQLPTAGDPEKYPGVAENVHYKEGVFVGYRWYDENNFEPAFPFGHGLSYTTFGYRDLKITQAKPGSGAVATVSVAVTNTGTRPGVAVPQLYLGLPDPAGDVGQPPKQLKGFKKLTLAPGQTERVTFSIDARALSYWDVTSDSWRIAPGCYQLMVGSSSGTIHRTGTLAKNSTTCGTGAVTLP